MDRSPYSLAYRSIQELRELSRIHGADQDELDAIGRLERQEGTSEDLIIISALARKGSRNLQHQIDTQIRWSLEPPEENPTKRVIPDDSTTKTLKAELETLVTINNRIDTLIREIKNIQRQAMTVWEEGPNQSRLRDLKMQAREKAEQAGDLAADSRRRTQDIKQQARQSTSQGSPEVKDFTKAAAGMAEEMTAAAEAEALDALDLARLEFDNPKPATENPASCASYSRVRSGSGAVRATRRNLARRVRNPIYKVPGVTVLLGTVLDLDLSRYQYRLRVDAFSGAALLAAENGIDQAPGYAKLYLLKGKPEQTADQPAATDYGSETYRKWHSREPERIAEMQTPDDIGYYQGRVLRIGYRSDKYNHAGQTADYDHLFIDGGGTAPKIYTDAADLEKSTTAVIVGGDFTITERGIE